jgi:hypothetical protein
MPHPAGLIVFDLKRTGTEGLTGKIILPEGVSGNFTWKGKTTALKNSTNISF